MRIQLVFLALLTAACGNDTTPPTIAHVTASVPAATGLPSSSLALITASPTSQSASCDDWQSWPVVPTVSETALAVYQRGQANGRDAHAFSKIGDGEISTAWFLSAFDLGSGHYELGPHQYLLPTIEYFDGSFERIGVAAKPGFNTHKLLDATGTIDVSCMAGESPLPCELRLHQPAFAILSLGTN